MPIMKDATGLRSGRIEVIYDSMKPKRTKVWCLCDCGEVIHTRVYFIRSKTTQSCGCLQRESATTHGMTKHPVYKVWISMIERCTNKNNPCYHHYGGRGIQVCDEWLHSFQCFFDYVGDRPTPKHQIDRIRNDDPIGYAPGNVRWVTAKENSSNRRSNVLLTANGRTETQSDWSRILEVYVGTIIKRLKKGQSFQQIHDHFTRRGRLKIEVLTANGETKSQTEWGRQIGVDGAAIHYWRKKGMTMQEITDYYAEKAIKNSTKKD